MSKIYFQGTFGAYSHLAALSVDKNAEILPCKTFDDCFNKGLLGSLVADNLEGIMVNVFINFQFIILIKYI